jgi:phospholipase C
MMPRWYPKIVLSDEFRRFDWLAIDFRLEPDATFPRVIFVEPKYTDSPHLGEGTDDHSPSSVLGGQQFLLSVYQALIANSNRWRRTVMIITYDEHGGFFDHVQPLPLVTKAPSGQYPDFISSGVRIPALIISPLVTAGRVESGDFDHTSILKFLGAKFGSGKYSPAVDARHVGNVIDALDLNSPRQMIPKAPHGTVISSTEPYVRGIKPQVPGVTIFQQVAHDLTTRYPHELATKFPEHVNFLGV